MFVAALPSSTSFPARVCTLPSSDQCCIALQNEYHSLIRIRDLVSPPYERHNPITTSSVESLMGHVHGSQGSFWCIETRSTIPPGEVFVRYDGTMTCDKTFLQVKEVSIVHEVLFDKLLCGDTSTLADEAVMYDPEREYRLPDRVRRLFMWTSHADERYNVS